MSLRLLSVVVVCTVLHHAHACLDDSAMVKFQGKEMSVGRFNTVCTKAIQDLKGVAGAIERRTESQWDRINYYYKESRENPKTFWATCNLKFWDRCELPNLKWSSKANEVAENTVTFIKSAKCTCGKQDALIKVKKRIKFAEHKLNGAIQKLNKFIRKFEGNGELTISFLKATKYASFTALTIMASAGAPLVVATKIAGGVAASQELLDQVGWHIADKRAFKPWKIVLEGGIGALTTFLAAGTVGGFDLGGKFPKGWKLNDLARLSEYAPKILGGFLLKHKNTCFSKGITTFGEMALNGGQDPDKAAGKALADCYTFELTNDKSFWYAFQEYEGSVGKTNPSSKLTGNIAADSKKSMLRHHKDLAPEESNLFDSRKCNREKRGSECMYKHLCKGGNRFVVSHRCPGAPKGVKCCIHAHWDVVLPRKDEKCAFAGGRCLDIHGKKNRDGFKCQGTLKTGMCGGPSTRQCCIGDSANFPAESSLEEGER